VSLADVSSRIAAIQARTQSLAATRPAAVSRFGGAFDATMASLVPRTDVMPTATDPTGTVPDPVLDTAGTTASSGRADGDDIAAWASRYVGVPYVAGGRSPKGWDCAGFTHWVAEQYGISIPEVSWLQIKQGTPVANLDQAKPGDLLFFHEPGGHRRDPSPLKVNHVAIYLGDGKMVEAANPRAGTRISSVDTAHLVGIRRVAPTGDGVARTPDQVAAASGVAVSGPTATASARATAAAASGALGPKALVQLLESVGFKGEGLRTAWAVAMRESHGRPGAVSPPNSNGTRDHGLFQLNDIHLGRSIDASQVYDAEANARAAYRMTKGGTNWSAWAIGTTGWAGHLAEAQPAAYARMNAAFRAWYDRFPGA
jgi:cell wall-associated NlpC family hydrolase